MQRRRGIGIVGVVLAASAFGCDGLDTLGTQTDPALLERGEPETLRVAATAEGFTLDEPFVIRVDRLAYASDSTRLVPERIRCVIVQVASASGTLTDPYDGAQVTELQLLLDRGASTYLSAVSDTAETFRLRATLFDVEDCALVDPDVTVLASRERGIAPAF